MQQRRHTMKVKIEFEFDVALKGAEVNANQTETIARIRSRIIAAMTAAADGVTNVNREDSGAYFYTFRIRGN